MCMRRSSGGAGRPDGAEQVYLELVYKVGMRSCYSPVVHATATATQQAIGAQGRS